MKIDDFVKNTWYASDDDVFKFLYFISTKQTLLDSSSYDDHRIMMIETLVGCVTRYDVWNLKREYDQIEKPKFEFKPNVGDQFIMSHYDKDVMLTYVNKEERLNGFSQNPYRDVIFYFASDEFGDYYIRSISRDMLRLTPTTKYKNEIVLNSFAGLRLMDIGTITKIESLGMDKYVKVTCVTDAGEIVERVVAELTFSVHDLLKARID